MKTTKKMRDAMRARLEGYEKITIYSLCPTDVIDLLDDADELEKLRSEHVGNLNRTRLERDEWRDALMNLWMEEAADYSSDVNPQSCADGLRKMINGIHSRMKMAMKDRDDYARQWRKLRSVVDDVFHLVRPHAPIGLAMNSAGKGEELTVEIRGSMSDPYDVPADPSPLPVGRCRCGAPIYIRLGRCGVCGDGA